MTTNLPAMPTGLIAAQVGAYIEPITRFGPSDIVEIEAEKVFDVQCVLTVEQSVKFSIEFTDGPKGLPVDVRSRIDKASADEGLSELLEDVQNDTQQSLKLWADTEPGTYRRLLPGNAAFLREPSPIGHQEKCKICSGAGKKKCAECNGAGSTKCKKCSGTRKMVCPLCSGSLRMTCSSCHGRGSLTEYQTEYRWNSITNTNDLVQVTTNNFCYPCNGSGRKTCNACQNGNVICTNCSIDGTCPCKSCKSKGYFECKPCHASGLMHRFGKITASTSFHENLQVITDDEEFKAVVINSIPVSDLPDLGKLVDTSFKISRNHIEAIHCLTITCRSTALNANDASLRIFGFGNSCKIYNYHNFAGILLENDLIAMEEATSKFSGWRRQSGVGLLAHLKEFLQSELNILIAERLHEIKSTPEQVAKDVAKHFANAVDATYVSRSTKVLQSALAKSYGSELTEPALYLCALIAVSTGLLSYFGWFNGSQTVLLISVLCGATVIWATIEFLARRRIKKHFPNEYGKRLINQLYAFGTLTRWRVGFAVGALLTVFGALKGVEMLPASQQKQVASLEVSSTIDQIATWSQQTEADFKLRSYPSQDFLLSQAEQGNNNAQTVVAWRLLLGAKGVDKDVVAAGRWLDSAKPNSSQLPLWYAARAVYVLNQEAMPDAILAAASDLARAAESGLVEARYWEARIFMTANSPLLDLRRAQALLTQAAEKQHSHAALLLGQRLARGDGFLKDTEAARRWLVQADTAGLADAQTELDTLK